MRSGLRSLLLFFFGALAGLLLVYWKTRQFDFIDGDDDLYVLNARVAAPLTAENLWWLLTHPIEFNWTPLS